MTTASDADDSTGTRASSAIVNVLQVIRCFTLEQPLVGVTDIAGQVGLHKSSVSRILATLEQEHVVERDETSRKYRLGLGLIAVAGPLLANLDVRRVAMSDLQLLADGTAETVALSIWDGTAAVTVEQIPSPHRVKHTSALGSRYSGGANATVQVFLSGQDPDRVRALVEAGRIDLGGSGDAEGYLARLHSVRTRGFAVNSGETAPDEIGVAAPIIDHRGGVCGAVLLAAPAYRVSREDIPALATACRNAARRISLRLGAAPA